MYEVCYSFKLNNPCEPHSYEPVSSQLDSIPSAERRRIPGIKFSGGLLRGGNIDSPDLFSLIRFEVPRRSSRSVAPFYVPLATTDLVKNEPTGRMMQTIEN